MKRSLLPVFAIALLSLFLACSGNQSPKASPVDLSSPAVQGVIEIARTLGRSAITVYLGSKGVPPEATLLIFQEVDPIVDELIAGQKVSLVFDAAAFAPERAKLVARLSAAITKNAKVKGVPVIDQGTADLLAGQAVDAAVAEIRRYVKPPATAPATPTAQRKVAIGREVA